MPPPGARCRGRLRRPPCLSQRGHRDRQPALLAVVGRRGRRVRAADNCADSGACGKVRPAGPERPHPGSVTDRGHSLISIVGTVVGGNLRRVRGHRIVVAHRHDGFGSVVFGSPCWSAARQLCPGGVSKINRARTRGLRQPNEASATIWAGHERLRTSTYSWACTTLASSA